MSNWPKLDDYKRRALARHGDKCDFSELDNADPTIRDAYETGARMAFNYTADSKPMRADRRNAARGYVGITTGWHPVFILVVNTRSLGGDLIPNGAIALAYSNAAGYGRHKRKPLLRDRRINR